jgi:hypothetical protein
MLHMQLGFTAVRLHSRTRITDQLLINDEFSHSSSTNAEQKIIFFPSDIIIMCETPSGSAPIDLPEEHQEPNEASRGSKTIGSRLLGFLHANEFLVLVVLVILLAKAYPDLGARHVQPQITATWIAVIYIFGTLLVVDFSWDDDIVIRANSSIVLSERSHGGIRAQDGGICQRLWTRLLQCVCSSVQLWRHFLGRLWLLSVNDGGWGYFEGFSRWDGNLWLSPDHCEYVCGADQVSAWR